MQILPQQPSTIAKILDTSFKLYAAGFTKVIGMGVIISLFYVALTFLSASLSADLPAGAGSEAAQALMLKMLPALVGYVVLISLLTFIFYAAILYRIDNVAQQRSDGFGEAVTVGLKKFPGMLWAAILYGLAVAGGSLLFLVPGIALMLSLSFYPVFIVVEDLSGYAALKASHRLVWGHWWRTLTIYMAPGVLMLIVYIALGLISYPLGGDNASPGAVSVGDIFSNLLSAFVMPYFYTLAYVVYHDLKLRKSGGDLAARLAD
ncbi:MAG: YciC family protein [Gammaproteobacteria bacterium]